jgi:hypothetical protein
LFYHLGAFTALGGDAIAVTPHGHIFRTMSGNCRPAINDIRHFLRREFALVGFGNPGLPRALADAQSPLSKAPNLRIALASYPEERLEFELAEGVGS